MTHLGFYGIRDPHVRCFPRFCMAAVLMGYVFDAEHSLHTPIGLSSPTRDCFFSTNSGCAFRVPIGESVVVGDLK